jgi:hypothetical protein
VVVEMLGEHPMAWLDPLWVRFHDLHRPRPPPPTTPSRCCASWAAAGVQRWERPDPRARTRLDHGAAACRPSGSPRWRRALVTTPPRPRVAATLVWS